MVLSGSEIVIEELIRHGVDIVFGYPGANVIDIYDGLYKNSHRITHILTAHEQGAAHAADAYARVTGRTSAVIATSGPGATNLVTGIANAYLDSVPVVFITGNVTSHMLGRDSFQEIDIMGVTLPIVKHSYVVREIKTLQYRLREAFLIAGSGRKGPVLVDIPKNVQIDTCEYDPDLAVSLSGSSEWKTDLSGLDEALKLIENSKRPYIYCGGGVSAADAQAGVVALSKKLSAPVGVSIMGIGAAPHSYELYLGMSGMHGRYASTVAKSEADLVIALGARFSDRATGNTQEFAKNSAIIHVDIDAAEFGKNISPSITLRGDLSEVLPKLVNQSRTAPDEKWLQRVRELKASDNFPNGDEFVPRNIISCVNKFFGDSVVTTDVGQHQMWVAQYYKFEKPRKFITSGGLGAMGFGLGAAVGACMACGRERTVLFTGDGSFGMNLTEMATAVTHDLPITIILINNGALGLVRQLQTLFLGGRHSQTTLNRATDFPALARDFGAKGFSASSISELTSILENTDGCGPCLVDCKIDIDEKVLPMIPAGGTLGDMLR